MEGRGWMGPTITWKEGAGRGYVNGVLKCAVGGVGRGGMGGKERA